MCADYLRRAAFSLCLRLAVVQDEVHSLLAVKLYVARQLLVCVGVNAHWESRMPFLPSRHMPERNVLAMSYMTHFSHATPGHYPPVHLLPEFQFFASVLLGQSGLVFLRQVGW